MSSGATALLASRCESVCKFVRGRAAPQEGLEETSKDDVLSEQYRKIKSSQLIFVAHLVRGLHAEARRLLRAGQLSHADKLAYSPLSKDTRTIA